MASSWKGLIVTHLKAFFADPCNVYALALVLLIPIVYESLRFTPVESNMIPHTFSPALTIWLQERLGTNGIIAYAASYYYVIPHIILMAGLVPMFVFAKNRPAWVYMMMAVSIFIVDSLIYIAYPVAPPVRLEGTGAVPIRINLFELSETTITAHYSALPSGHIFTTVLGLLIAIVERWKWPAVVYGVNTIVMTVIIVYLGDHYLIDSVASVVLVICIYAIVWGVARRTSYVKTKYSVRKPFSHDVPCESCAPRRQES